MKINDEKAAVMKWNVNLRMKIQREGSDIEEVQKFVYHLVLQSHQLVEQVRI